MKFRVAVLALGLAAAGSLCWNRMSVSAQGQKSQWNGIYTEAQAKRGGALYKTDCESCHGATLEGGEMAPPLAGADFLANWDGLPLGELVERMRTTMPSEEPGKFSRQQNADMLAYMFWVDKVPAGKTDLPGRADALNAIKFVGQRPDAK